MSCFIKSINEGVISIPQICELEGVIFYEILVKIGQINWTVRHRYSDFYDLHEKLVEKRSISKDLLPPKKVIGAKSPQFLEKRRTGLEKYLQEIFIYLQMIMPREFIEFLDFHKYDIIFLLQSLAYKFYLLSNSINRNYQFQIIELYSITERLKIPCPQLEYCKSEYDFSHILDFCSNLQSIVVQPYNSISENNLLNSSCGSSGAGGNLSCGNLLSYYNNPIGTSNVIPSKLLFELSAFKELSVLTVKYCSTENIYNLGTLRDTLRKFNVHFTGVDELNKIILCDDIHKDQMNIEDPSKIWRSLKEINFSSNAIKSIDCTINLAPNLEILILDNNGIETVQNLDHLTKLSTLSLCSNKISNCIDLHVELGNLVELNLSENAIKTLSGFHKLYSLVTLILSCNQVTDINEIDYLSRLQCLEYLCLTGNPIAGSVDYRPRVLSRFPSRLNEIYLDNEKGNQHELDTALVLSALRVSQLGNDAFAEQFNSMYCSIKR